MGKTVPDLHARTGRTDIGALTIRRWADGDDLAQLTALIHAAYRPHALAGLRYWGTHQTVEHTAQRLAAGAAWLLLDGASCVGTATLRPPQPASPVALYRQPGVHALSQFCVHPELAGRGLGRLLHDHIVDQARQQGASGIALDTAMPATGLIRLYERWGYQRVGSCDWRPHTNYVSVVMYLDIARAPEPAD